METFNKYFFSIVAGLYISLLSYGIVYIIGTLFKSPIERIEQIALYVSCVTGGYATGYLYRSLKHEK